MIFKVRISIAAASLLADSLTPCSDQDEAIRPFRFALQSLALTDRLADYNLTRDVGLDFCGQDAWLLLDRHDSAPKTFPNMYKLSY